MPVKGNSYTITLRATHIQWGIHRYTKSRNPITNEGYIPIPKRYSTQFEIYNSNHSPSGLGINEFHVTSADGFIKNQILLAQGSAKSEDIYAKQFSIKGDLTVIGNWYNFIKAKPGDQLKITWSSPYDIFLEFIPVPRLF